MPRFRQPQPQGGVPIYKYEFVEQARKLCLLGATRQELADFFEVSTVTIDNWRLKHKAFQDAVNVGKEHSDERVVHSLYHRAVGYCYDAVKVIPGRDGEEPVYAEYRAHVPPDVRAISMWLTNRKSKEWKDKVEDVNDNTTTIVIKGGLPNIGLPPPPMKADTKPEGSGDE